MHRVRSHLIIHRLTVIDVGDADPEDANQQEGIESKILSFRETGPLKRLIARDGQLEPGVITADGYVVNGNRRLAVLRSLAKEIVIGENATATKHGFESRFGAHALCSSARWRSAVRPPVPSKRGRTMSNRSGRQGVCSRAGIVASVAAASSRSSTVSRMPSRRRDG